MAHKSSNPVCRSRHALGMRHQNEVVVRGLRSQQHSEFTMTHGTCLLVDLGMHQDVGTLIHHRENILSIIARIVIEHDDLVLGIVLIEQNGQIPCQCLSLVVTINQDTHARLLALAKKRCLSLPTSLTQYTLPDDKVQYDLNKPGHCKHSSQYHQPKGIMKHLEKRFRGWPNSCSRSVRCVLQCRHCPRQVQTSRPRCAHKVQCSDRLPTWHIRR